LRKLLPLWDSKPRLSNPQTNHHYDSVIPAPVILFWACHNQKCILSLLTLDNSKQLPQSSFLWYHHDSETSTLALSGTSLKGWKFTSATLTWAGHMFWRNELLGLKQLPAITGQFTSPDCNATGVSHEE